MSSHRGVTPPPVARRGALILFCAATFLFWASLHVYVPILAVYAEALGASLSMVGIVVSSYAIAQLLLRIPVGVWADALGRRKPFILAGFFVAALGGLGLALAPDPWFLFAGRLTTGVAAATWVAFTVFFAGYFPLERTARAMGLIAFVNGAATVVASLVGGMTAQLWGWQATFFLGMALALLALPFILTAPEAVVASARPFSYRGFLRVASSPLLLLASLIGILSHFVAYSTSQGFVPVYGAQIGASKAELGFLLTLMFASSSLANLGGVYLGERWGYSATLLLGFLLWGVANLAIPFVHSVPLLGATQVASGAGRGLTYPVLMALSLQAVSPSERATAMGVFQALYAIGMFTGPLASGFLADGVGIGSVFYLSAALALVCGGLAFFPLIGQRTRGVTAAPPAPR